jgi:hypothetical protein
VAFHLELHRGHRTAWVFNLDEPRLHAELIEPWRRGEPAKLADREWDPRESSVRILEGPALEGPELAHGRGPHNAERAGEDVTRRVLGLDGETAKQFLAVRALGPAGHEALEGFLERLGPDELAQLEVIRRKKG